MASLPEPSKKIPYPIAHDENGGSLFVYEPTTQDVKRVVLCCPGFPDDHEAFMPLASRLAKEQDCLVGVMCLPGFDDRPERHWQDHWKDGYTLEEIVLAFKEGEKALLTEACSHCKREDLNYTVILHDWAVAVGMKQINRSTDEEADSKPDISLIPNQIVILDVGLPFHPQDQGKPKLRALMWPDKDTPLYDATSELSYRFILAFMFFLQRYVSRILAIIMFGLGAAFLNTFRIGPTVEIDNKVIRDRKPNPVRLAYMSYVYYNLVSDMVSGTLQKFEEHATLPILDNIDILYMYGTEKRIMFHDKKMADFLNDFAEKGGGSQAIRMDGAGHWFYIQQPERAFQEICKFLLDRNRSSK